MCSVCVVVTVCGVNIPEWQPHVNNIFKKIEHFFQKNVGAGRWELEAGKPLICNWFCDSKPHILRPNCQLQAANCQNCNGNDTGKSGKRKSESGKAESEKGWIFLKNFERFLGVGIGKASAVALRAMARQEKAENSREGTQRTQSILYLRILRSLAAVGQNFKGLTELRRVG